MNELALFAGAGGGILGGHLLGWRTVCAVEWADYPRRVLLARQRDGMLPRFPIWDDVQTFDGNPWRGRVDVVSGGFPCQDISAAGKGAGIDGARSGMWFHMARIVREVRPRFVFVENSPMLTSRGLGRVLGDLAEMGYDAEWCVLGAVDLGAHHQRERIWIVAHDSSCGRGEGRAWRSDPGCAREREFTLSDVAHADRRRCDREETRKMEQPRGAAIVCGGDAMADSDGTRLEERNGGAGEAGACAATLISGLAGRNCEISDAACRRDIGSVPQSDFRAMAKGDGTASYGWRWPTEPNVGRVAHGVARRVDRLKAIGNGQVPVVAAAAFRLLIERAGWAL